jgi:uncharacterized membrane protein
VSKARRLALKSLSYRLVSITVTVGIAMVASGDWHKALAVGGLDGAVKVFLFAAHEAAWGGLKG